MAAIEAGRDEYRFGFYLTTGPDPKGRGLLAIMSDGSPQFGHDPVTVLTLEIVPSVKAAKAWFKRMKRERPWVRRQ